MPDDDDWQSLVIAAGRGRRMLSDVPKALHSICGVSLLNLASRVVFSSGIGEPVLVVSPAIKRLAPNLSEKLVVQQHPDGTASAVEAGLRMVPKTGSLLVGSADAVLVNPDTLTKMMRVHRRNAALLTVLTAKTDTPQGLGRVIRDVQKRPMRVVEQADLDVTQDGVLNEINVGWYCFDIRWLKSALDEIKPSSTGERYLTGLIASAASAGGAHAVVCEAEEESYGINDTAQLVRAEKVLRKRINARLVADGVFIRAPEQTYIDADVQIGAGSVVDPGASLKGQTTIGKNCRIGHNAVILDTKIGRDVVVGTSYLEQTTVGDGAHIGNFAELKRSRIGTDANLKHFCYVGDAIVGARANLGAGTVTCNYDGKRKSTTEIGADAFIGAGTMLVAPLKIGVRASTGAGSVVTKNVPRATAVAGVPASVRD